MKHGLVAACLVWALTVGALAQTPEPRTEESDEQDATVAPSEPLAESDRGPLLALSRLDIGGYVHADLRYEEDGDEEHVYFEVRRGRLKLTYDFDIAGLVLQIDATENGVDVKDAHGSIDIPMPDGIAMTVLAGLLKIPFGFDLQYSSSRRLFPERAQMVQRLFPGERDLGVRLDATFADELLEVQLAIQNGVPLGDDQFGEHAVADPDDYKDATLHVVVSPMEPLDVGVSALYGVGTRVIADDPTTPMVDESDEFDFPRWAVAGELRYQRQLGSLGGLDLYGELSYSRNLARQRASDYPPNADTNVSVLAWYVAVVQELGDLFAVGARFDRYAVVDGETLDRITAAGMAEPGEGVRLVLAADFDLSDAADHEAWLRMQVKF